MEKPDAAAPGPGTHRVRKGQEFEGRISAAGERESTAETARGPVRVRGGVPGDRVLLRIHHVGKHALWGRIVHVLEPSPDRVEPRCRVTRICGGCPWQSWAPEAQSAERARLLAAALAPATKVPVQRPSGPPEVYGFRNKMLLSAGGRIGNLTLGLYQPRSHRLVSAVDCPVHVPEGNRVIAALKTLLDALQVPPWREEKGDGLLRAVLVRVAPGTGETGVVLYLGKVPPDGGKRIGERILRIPGVASVWSSGDPKPGPVAPGAVPKLLAGRPRILARVGPTEHLCSPATFFQTNSAALPLLVETVRDCLPPRVGHLVDLYAGAGLFALPFARRSRRVTAVEADPAAAADLIASTARGRLRNLGVRPGDAADFDPDGPPPDVVIADPPRAGLPGPLLDRWTSGRGPGRIIYVSCAPAALGRDLVRLVGGGYAVERVVALDLFPHTPHLETVVLLTKPGSPSSSKGPRGRAGRGRGGGKGGGKGVGKGAGKGAGKQRGGAAKPAHRRKTGNPKPGTRNR